MSGCAPASRLRIAASALWLCLCVSAHAAVPSAEYDAAIREARTGAAPAIEKLENWRRLYPDDKRLVHDLATLLGLQGRHEAALQYYSQIVDPDSPAYAIKSMAASARAENRAQDAERAYQLLLTKAPDDAEAHAGLAYAWMELGRVEDALAYIESRVPGTPSLYTRKDMPLLVALAELREQRKEWLLAADAYGEVLKLEPEFRYALRGRVFALGRAGIPALAKRLADSRHALFDNEELRRLAHEAAARSVVFGQAKLATDDTPSRFAATDAALFENAEVSRRFGNKAATRFDRLVALRDRMQMREAVELYETLVADKVAVPSYAKAAAADAYLYLEQPDIAHDLYLETLGHGENREPEKGIDRQASLIYAYIESEQHAQAQAKADELLRITPAMIHQGLRGLEQPNPDYTRALIMRATMPMYADQLDAAEQRLGGLRASAPANNEIRAVWASLQWMRERPRKALEEFTLLRIDDPKSVDAAVGYAESMLALNEFGEARALARSLLSDYPEKKAVQNFARKLERHERPQLKVDVNRGSGGSTAAADSVLDATLHSAPLKDLPGERYRAFTHVSRSSSETGALSVTRTRAGAGVDYRARDIAVEAELNRATGAADSSGLLLVLRRSVSDAWHINMAVDTNVNDLPAVAFHNDVTARAYQAGITWIAHESRKAGGELAQLRFSDRNVRNTVRLWWTERWISGPVFKLESTLGLYTSGNSLSSPAYFNPARDREASLRLTGEWLAWRRYHRAFTQRLAYTPAYYRQQGFGGAAAGDVRYEHEWRDDRNLAFRYGLGRGFHRYDGNREDRGYGYLSLYWQIK